MTPDAELEAVEAGMVSAHARLRDAEREYAAHQVAWDAAHRRWKAAQGRVDAEGTHRSSMGGAIMAKGEPDREGCHDNAYDHWTAVAAEAKAELETLVARNAGSSEVARLRREVST